MERDGKFRYDPKEKKIVMKIFGGKTGNFELRKIKITYKLNDTTHSQLSIFIKNF